MTLKTLKAKLRTLKEILHGSGVHHIERGTEMLFQISSRDVSHVCKGNKQLASQLCAGLPPSSLFGVTEAGFFPLHSDQFIFIFLSPSGTSTENDCAFEPDYAIPPLPVTEGMQHIRIMEGMSRSLPSSPLLTHQSISVRLQPVKKLTGKDFNKVHWGF